MAWNGLNFTSIRRGLRWLWLSCACLFLPACRTPAPLPAVDTSQPGWVVRQGQATWKTRAGAEEIVGEIILATHLDGRSLLQFTKLIPLLSAQIHGEQWQISYLPQKRILSGKGQPPPHAVWLHLAPALAGKPPGTPLHFHETSKDQVTLFNQITGETVSVYFAP